MARSGANPHVSLAIWEDIDIATMSAAVADVCRGIAVVQAVFDRVAVFPEAGVVFLGVRSDAGLSAAQARCHRALGAYGRRPWVHYAPDAWVPHCTLAQEVDGAASLARARAAADRLQLPLAARLVRAELVRFHPVHCVAAVPLSADATAS